MPSKRTAGSVSEREMSFYYNSQIYKSPGNFIFSHEAEDFSFLDGEIHPVHRAEFLVIAGQVLDMNHEHSFLLFLSRITGRWAAEPVFLPDEGGKGFGRDIHMDKNRISMYQC